MTVKKPTGVPKINDKPTAIGQRANDTQAKNWTKHNQPKVKGNSNWLTKNLPPTTAPYNPRPGAEYEVEV